VDNTVTVRHRSGKPYAAATPAGPFSLARVLTDRGSAIRWPLSVAITSATDASTTTSRPAAYQRSPVRPESRSENVRYRGYLDEDSLGGVRGRVLVDGPVLLAHLSSIAPPGGSANSPSVYISRSSRPGPVESREGEQ